MPEPLAVVIEDDPESAAETKSVLEQAGFSVVVRYSATDALAHGSDLRADLFVVDRNLPAEHGSEPSNDVGDRLLNDLVARFSDAVFVLFTGNTDREHHVFATTERGRISAGSTDHVFDRVRSFKKSEALEFDDYIARVSQTISWIDDVSVTGPGTSADETNTRLLRRVARHFGGISVSARALSGGLSKAPVWMCEVTNGVSVVARVVAKKTDRPLPVGGFHATIPAHVGVGVTSITGFLGGGFASAQQIAGASPESLLDLLADRPDVAAETVSKLVAAIDGGSRGNEQYLPISTVVSPVRDWDRLVSEAELLGLSLPSGTRVAPTTTVAVHADLHPGNVLVETAAPLVIDFDSECQGSPLVDAMSLLLGSIVHPASPLRDAEWPRPAQFADPLGPDFLNECPATDYFKALQDWCISCATSTRESAALLLAYAVRHLSYPDNNEHERTRTRLMTLAEHATSKID